VRLRNIKYINGLPLLVGSTLRECAPTIFVPRSKPVFTCLKDKPKLSGLPLIANDGTIIPELFAFTKANKHDLLDGLIKTVTDRIMHRLCKNMPKTNLTSYLCRLIKIVSTIYVFSGNHGVIRRSLSCIYQGMPKGIFPILQKQVSKLTTNQGFSASLSLRGQRLLPYRNIRDTENLATSGASHDMVLETLILKRLRIIDTRGFNEMYCRNIYIDTLSSLWCLHQRDARVPLFERSIPGETFGTSFYLKALDQDRTVEGVYR